jgi:hypothetical protein
LLGENLAGFDGWRRLGSDDAPSLHKVLNPLLQMPFVKKQKNDAYFSRFQVKYRRRREGKTDCAFLAFRYPKSLTVECRLRAEAPDHPGQEQVQRAQVPPRRPLLQQGGHLPGRLRPPSG